ncbi:helix-turn-helix domain-containing protein [Scandinavium goeteborgense]|uniref:helix-turn-helix domain-containing protein n=1 Tax=Scandinavium goeteborgense TaxID=1851514 RepID=UPI00144842E8|nr:helix-turn-helix domain-containing protein [Scandinavium goeteborgense]
MLAVNDAFERMDLSPLIDIIIAEGVKISLPMSESFIIPDDRIYFIIEGNVSVSVRSDDFILARIFKHIPLGLVEQYFESIELDYFSNVDTQIFSISIVQWESMVSMGGEISIIATKILSRMIAALVEVYSERNAETHYIVIRSLLYRYIHQFSRGMIHKESISAYITERTKISRSHTFKILQELKIGKYITVDKGILISINRELPLQF